ncbi:MAG: response regulator [Spongiibacteraceae bacterium]|jgi:CheY-like chemotaxis protein|nr:response regulator [Spongiibacteraceae bacterium]
MPSADKAHILLVEDERGISSAFALLLKIEGFRVTVAADGQAALDMLDQSKPDLILTDLRMPVMDGLELIQRVRAEPQHASIPILLMSGALPESVAPAPFGGADAFLQMPAGVAELLNVIERLLKERAQAA